MQHGQDFDLHGIVGIRVEEARATDIATVSRQLGPIRQPLGRTPDISIRFVDRLPTGPLTCVGVGDTSFDEHGFYVVRGRGATQAKALFPFDAVGGPMQIVCERAWPAVPHLLSCINMVALTKDVLPLHASAFELDGRGILVMGWAKGGKTEALLAGMDRGASYIGDEWIYISEQGELFGLPEPIRLWAWHLAQQPHILASRGSSDRARVATWRGLASVARGAGKARGPGSGMARRAQPLLERQAFLQIPPSELFGPDRIALQGRLDAAVLMLSHDAADIEVGRAGPGEISGRMAASLAHERERFLDHYRQFRFAFPSRRSAVVESASERETELLRSLFDGRDAATVAHPYPCDITALGDAVSAAVGGSRVPGQREEVGR